MSMSVSTLTAPHKKKFDLSKAAGCETHCEDLTTPSPLTGVKSTDPVPFLWRAALDIMDVAQ